MYAAKKCYKEIFELLLKQKDINISMINIFKSKAFITFKSNFIHFIDLYNGLWNSICVFNDTALLFAVKNGHADIVEILLRYKDIDVNIKDILNQKHL